VYSRSKPESFNQQEMSPRLLNEPGSDSQVMAGAILHTHSANLEIPNTLLESKDVATSYRSLRQSYLAMQYPDSHTHFCCPWGCSDLGHGNSFDFGQCFSLPQASSLISDMFWRSEMQTCTFQHHPHHGTTLQLLFVWQALYLVDNFPS
jgi:hypothetical protein